MSTSPRFTVVASNAAAAHRQIATVRPAGDGRPDVRGARLLQTKRRLCAILAADVVGYSRLTEAFEEAKRLATDRTRWQSLFVFGQQDRAEVQAIMGPDPFAYGLAANAAMIDRLQAMSVEQGLTSVAQAWSEIFPEETLIAEEAVLRGREA